MIPLVIIAACSLPADPHWAVGGWQTGLFGGPMIRPDHWVIERDPEGNVTDVGVWYEFDDDTIGWTSMTQPTKEHYLSRDGTYFHTFFSGYHSPKATASRCVVPEEFDDYVLGFEEDEQ